MSSGQGLGIPAWSQLGPSGGLPTEHLEASETSTEPRLET